jgi:PII-like signaling protein
MKGHLLKIIVEFNTRYQGKPLFEYIADICLKKNISGLSVFKAVEGYGKSKKIHEHDIFSKNEPISIEIVDSKENIENILPILQDILKELNTGLITLEEVEIIR